MIYLDSAATTFQKPLSVSYAMQRAMRTMSSPGRGGYAAARAAEETAFRCRSLAAELFGVPSPEQVVFTSNATHALNIAIRSLVPEGGRVAVSGYEHNAVTRPLHALGARIKVAASPLFDLAALLRAGISGSGSGANGVSASSSSRVIFSRRERKIFTMVFRPTR